MLLVDLRGSVTTTQTEHAMSDRDTVLARRYVEYGGHRCQELVQIYGRTQYYITMDGRIPNARHKIGVAEAQEFWDDAPYKIGPRPDFPRRPESAEPRRPLP